MVKKYIKFLTKATNQHGVHSPFVYRLVTECIYKKTSSSVLNEFEYYKKILENNHTEITITDFGAGSKVFKDNKRKVSDLVSKVSVSKKYALLLNRLVNHLNINYALELGTSVGLGTASMCFNNINIKVDTIEGCDKTLNIAEKQFKKYFNQDQITTYCGDFSDLLPLLSVKKYDLIYFDGNHQKEATLKYFKECLKAKHNDSVFIFDDIYWSNDMEQAWEEIKNHAEVKVTVDLFQWGLVFFRKEQEKEHFKIRF
ncbi:class I SAM-dependent methyltransferase [Wenyingzhuangia sp. chi5]|uniref:Class I SAM-dependent methyltransferase n=1 Tax=Wenyingzhuangia gilva TaxID=3057677 RepID=A0ABT8VSB1_9FLAO|nr:class I SAM-dependent methyltransferase [Wenyingzhuangia sp. chi5]MDO3694853.1 class I SAM-dependent methyltransferase [Wenyingzhuangia sp. chi5]